MKLSSPESNATCIEYPEVLLRFESVSGLLILILFYLSTYFYTIASKYFREYLGQPYPITILFFFNLGYYVFSLSYEI